MQIQAGSHNGDPSLSTQRRSKLVYTMHIQAGSHNGDPSWFTQWRSKLVHTMEIQAGSHNGDPSWFTQRTSKLLHTMEIQAGSHNGDPSWFTQYKFNVGVGGALPVKLLGGHVWAIRARKGFGRAWAGGGGVAVIVSGVTHVRLFLARFMSVPGVPHPPSQAQYSVLIGIRAWVRGRRRRRVTEMVLTISVL